MKNLKVLITGGYGFIGSHVAERFNKEGWEVYIIDNLISGSLSNINFKHKGYQLSVEDPKCEEIFRSNRFNAVVHLAAQVNVTASINNPNLDTRSNVLGLVNMLSMAKKYGVEKFLFASSAAVYGLNEDLPINESSSKDPISPYGISKLVGESYCMKWGEIYELDTLCFRFSNVYGPRQGSAGEGGVVSIFMERIMQGEDLVIYGDGEQTRDFIYVEDVADAIFRSSYSSLEGVYNLSTGQECSVNNLAEVLTDLHGSANVVYQSPRTADIKRSVLSNKKIKRDLDWIPLYSYKEGLVKTYQWFKDHYVAQSDIGTVKVQSETATTLKQSINKVKPFIENLLAFAITAWLTLSQWDISYAFIDISMFYIVLIGIVYGNRQAITAVFLSVGLLIYEKLIDGRDIISLLYDTNFFFQVSVYLFIGLVVGYSIERKNRLMEMKNSQLRDIEERYEFLNKVYTEVREVKDELQLRIQNSGDSFGKIHSITKELESLEPEEIFTSTVSVIESIMQSRSVSIYMVNTNKSYLRLVAHSIEVTSDNLKSLKVEEHDYLRQMLVEGSVYLNKELEANAPMMSAPVMNNGEVVAVIAVYDITFDKFSLYYQNLFKTTVDLVSSALSRASSYIEATESQRYIKDTMVLTKDVFAMILKNKKLAKEKHNIQYMLMSQSGESIPLKEFSEKVRGLLRETDYVGIGENNELMVLLSNTGSQDAGQILDRFSKKNIKLNVIEEELVRG